MRILRNWKSSKAIRTKINGLLHGDFLQADRDGQNVDGQATHIVDHTKPPICKFALAHSMGFAPHQTTKIFSFLIRNAKSHS
jgi:hypothetical protein